MTDTMEEYIIKYKVVEFLTESQINDPTYEPALYSFDKEQEWLKHAKKIANLDNDTELDLFGMIASMAKGASIIRMLHSYDPDINGCEECSSYNGDHCVKWPCNTLRAMDGLYNMEGGPYIGPENFDCTTIVTDESGRKLDKI